MCLRKAFGNKGFFHISPSKKRQLIRCFRHGNGLSILKSDNVRKLFIRKKQNADVAVGRNMRFDAFDKRVCHFARAAKAQINRKLAHFKAFIQQIIAKRRCALAFFGVGYGQIEHDHHPH